MITGRGRPHEVMLLIASVLLGSAYLVGTRPPPTMAQLLPHWAVLVWAVTYVGSGVLGLVGCYWRGDIRDGLGVERGAMLMHTAPVWLYVLALAVHGARPGALVAGGVFFAWGCANLWRVWIITRDLRVIEGAHQ